MFSSSSSTNYAPVQLHTPATASDLATTGTSTPRATAAAPVFLIDNDDDGDDDSTLSTASDSEHAAAASAESPSDMSPRHASDADEQVAMLRAVSKYNDDFCNGVDGDGVSVDEDGGRVKRKRHSDCGHGGSGGSLSAWGGMQLCITALSAISGFLFGYDLCVMVIALPLIQTEFELTTSYAQSVVSVLMIGAVFGSLAGGVGADWIGRKPAIVVTALFFLLGSLLMTFAFSYTTMLLGRFLAGLAVGSSGPCVSVYLSEIAHPDRRGAVVTTNEVMLCVGCLVSVIISGTLQDSENGWRKMLAVTLLPPVVQLQNRTQEANAALRRLFNHRDYDVDASHPSHLKVQLSLETFNYSMWKAVRLIASDPSARRRVLLSMSIAFGHNLTGANAMLYYSSYILTELSGGGVPTTSHLAKEIGVAVAKVAGVCTAIAIVDRVGRRPLLLTGSVLMFASYVMFSMLFWIMEGETTTASHETLGIWNLYLFIYAWNLSWAPLMWVICAELLGDEFRSVGMGLTFAVFWLGSALSNQTLLSLFDAIGTTWTFLLYAVLTGCSLTFVFLKVHQPQPQCNKEVYMERANLPELSLHTIPSGSRDQGPHVRADRAALGSTIRAPASDSDLSIRNLMLLCNRDLFGKQRAQQKMTAQQQWEEFECMLSMFPEREELQFNDALRDQYKQYVSFNGARPLARLQYTIHYKTAQYFSQRIRPLPSELKDLGFGKEIPALEISYPPGYPEQDTVEFTVRCPFLSRHQTEALHTQLTLLATGAQGEVVVLQLYQQMLEVLTEVHVQYEENGADSMDLVQAVDSLRMTETGETQVVPEPIAGQMEVVLGRRAIYFHHIINPNKRRVVKEWALELQLGGFSKIGWPGIVLIEGREADAQEYVRRLQHLKWKQMVVRGEQIETSSTASTTDEGETATIDAMRRLPRGFQEFPENGMSALASACRDAGVEELFLTTMKIYGRASEISGTTTTAAAAQRSKGSKRNQKKPAKAAR